MFSKVVANADDQKKASTKSVPLTGKSRIRIESRKNPRRSLPQLAKQSERLVGRLGIRRDETVNR